MNPDRRPDGLAVNAQARRVAILSAAKDLISDTTTLPAIQGDMIGIIFLMGSTYVQVVMAQRVAVWKADTLYLCCRVVCSAHEE